MRRASRAADPEAARRRSVGRERLERRRRLGHPSVANGDPPRCHPREALVVRCDDHGRATRRREAGEERDDVRARWRCRGSRSARRRGRRAAPSRARGRSPPAVARRRTSAPADGGAIGEPDLVEQRERPGARLRVVDPGRRDRRLTLSTAVSVGIRLNCWKTKPKVRSRRSARAASPSAPRSWPSNRTVPSLARSSAPSSWSRVVFPEPLGPTSATSSPAPMSRSTPSSALTVEGPRRKNRAAPRTS